MSTLLRARGLAGRIRRGVVVAALGLLALAATVEGVLQVASLAVPDRSGAWRPDAVHRVLAVGDSHTWGSGVAREAAYPAQLQEQLDAARPGAWSVMNLGLPGMSTTQLRNRLSLWLTRYRPDVVIVWCGANNRWNHAELDRDLGNGWARLDGALSRLRLYRLVRVWLHDLPLERHAALSPEEQAWRLAHVQDPLGGTESWTVRHDGVAERIVHQRGAYETDAEALQARTERDLEHIVAIARAAGVELVFVTYPLDADFFSLTNRVVRQVAGRHALPVVEGPAALARIPPAQQQWEWALHPDARLYGEIATDLARTLGARG